MVAKVALPAPDAASSDLGASTVEPMDLEHGADASDAGGTTGEPTGLGADESDAGRGPADEDPGADGADEEHPEPMVLPTFRKGAYEYVIQTCFTRQEGVTVAVDIPAIVEIKRICTCLLHSPDIILIMSGLRVLG